MIWRSHAINFASKFNLCKSLVTPILLYGCETWIPRADSDKRIQAFETMCLRKLLRISHFDHKTNDWARSEFNFVLSSNEPLLATSFLHLHLFFNRRGRWGTTDDFTTSFLHFSLFFTALWDLVSSRSVHFLMLSSRLFFSLSCLLPPLSLCLSRSFWQD